MRRMRRLGDSYYAHLGTACIAERAANDIKLTVSPSAYSYETMEFFYLRVKKFR